MRNQNIGRLFLQAHRDFQRRALQKLQALGFSALSSAHITVLSHLAEEAMRTVVLAKRIGITKQSMSDLVRDLGLSRTCRRTKTDLPHQEDLDEFSLFFDHVGHESLFSHGFVTR